MKDINIEDIEYKTRLILFEYIKELNKNILEKRDLYVNTCKTKNK